MDKKTIIRVTSCFFGSILLVGFLQLISVGPNQKKNNFVRVFPPHFLGPAFSLNLKDPEFYIVGRTCEFIYLGNYTNPSQMIRVGWNLSDAKTFEIKLPDKERAYFSSFHLSLDSPFFYVNNFATGSVLRGLLSDPARPLTNLIAEKISTSIFLPVSERSFAFRTFDGNQKANILGKLFLDSPAIRLSPGILEKQTEGVFSTDGMLRFDSYSRRFVYIYFYRNQFLCLDSNLNIRYRAQTLDTNTQAKIRVVAIGSRQATAIASPGYRVSRAACLSSHWIFINSDLRADNEEKNIFEQFTVMDMYGLSDGHYHFSFYLPKKRGKINDLSLLGNKLITIQEHTLFIYSMNLDEIKK